MKTQIHELRTRIDGLTQLVKSLDRPILMISPSDLPPDMTKYEFLQQLKEPGQIMVVNEDSKPEYVGPGLSYIAETYKSLLLAKAWLGKVLAELGEETPYKNDGNRKTVEDIEPTADRSSGQGLFKDDFELLWWKNELTYIEKIDWLREEIQKQIDSIEEILHPVNMGDSEVDDQYCFILSEQHLSEACFHLGFELSKLKEQSKS